MSEVIATKEEMKDFLSSIDIQIRYEKGAGGNHHNFVVYFTPFPEKYINYLKKNNPSHNHFNGKKDYGNSTIYVGLCIRRRGGDRIPGDWTKKTYIRKLNNMNKITYQNTSGPSGYEVIVNYYRYHVKQRSLNQWIFPITYNSRHMQPYHGTCCKPMCASYNPNGSHKYYKYVRRAFLLPLTPTEAARGYKIFFDVFNGLRPLPNNDGVCGYILGNGIYYSSNCLRGRITYNSVSEKLTSHLNPLLVGK